MKRKKDRNFSEILEDCDKQKEDKRKTARYKEQAGTYLMNLHSTIYIVRENNEM
jgi:hypothetical protein